MPEILEPDLASATVAAMTQPVRGRVRTGAPSERVGFAVAPAPLGLGFALAAATERGLCALLLGNNPLELRAELQKRFRRADLHEDAALAGIVGRVFTALEGPMPELALDLRATAFQAQVWEALRAIPCGETRTYSELASALGRPGAARAVARACAVNPLAIAVPCHRVVGKSGALTGYRWGLERKERLLAAEREHHERTK